MRKNVSASGRDPKRGCEHLPQDSGHLWSPPPEALPLHFLHFPRLRRRVAGRTTARGGRRGRRAGTTRCHPAPHALTRGGVGHPQVAVPTRRVHLAPLLQNPARVIRAPRLGRLGAAETRLRPRRSAGLGARRNSRGVMPSWGRAERARGSGHHVTARGSLGDRGLPEAQTRSGEPDSWVVAS